MHPTLQVFIEVLSFVLLFMMIILVAKQLKSFFVRYEMDFELVKKDNLAVAVSVSGYYFAIALIFMGTLLGPSTDFVTDLVNVGGYSLLGIVFLNLAAFFNDKVIFKGYCSTKELIEDTNAGVGAVQMGCYIATGLIAGASVFGQGGGVTTALVFFLFGQIALWILSYLYNFISGFDLHDEIEKDNVAAGVSYGGAQVAMGILIAKGVGHNFVDWQTNFTWFLEMFVISGVSLPLVRLFIDKFMVTGDSLSKEISKDRNIGIGLLDALASISFSSVLFFLL